MTSRDEQKIEAHRKALDEVRTALPTLEEKRDSFCDAMRKLRAAFDKYGKDRFIREFCKEVRK